MTAIATLCDKLNHRAYLLDIEGTTTPIDFVTRTLFPYARERIAGFLASADFVNDSELLSALESLKLEHSADVTAGESPPEVGRQPDRFLAYLHWLMDRDRKSPGLKAIQGKIWESGYRSGELKGELYPDVVPAMRRWKAAGSNVYIYSSGSVLAQMLLFRYSVEGDLTSLINGYFDTGVGPKRSDTSYEAIASSIGVPAGEVLFLSDVIEEVAAARAAGLDAIQVVRAGGTLAPGQVCDFTMLAT